MVPQTECYEPLGDECIRGADQRTVPDTDQTCFNCYGDPDPGPYRFPARTSEWEGEAGAGLTITRFQELPELPDPEEWENV